MRMLILIALCSTPMIMQGTHAGELVDPTQPYSGKTSAKATASQSLHLQAILLGAQRRIAIINGQPVSEGDHIGAARITGIAPGKVTYRYGERQYSLLLADSTMDPARLRITRGVSGPTQ